MFRLGKQVTFVAAMSLWMLPTAGWGEPPVSFGTLVDEMIDLERLTRFPKPAYRLINLSSFDRGSDLPAGPGWFNNQDFSGNTGFEQVLREPGSDGVGTYLLCDLKGPGAIVRGFTVGIFGTLRVWLDDESKPFFEGPSHEFIQVPYRPFARQLKLDEKWLATAFGHGCTYFPIPFARRCRMEWTGKLPECHVYQFGVRLYEPGTPIKTFEAQDLVTYRSNIERMADVMGDVARKYTVPSATENRTIDVTVEPGKTAEALSLEGAAAIVRLSLRAKASDVDAALRQTVLHITFDGWPHAQVQCPLGDFFGSGPGVNPLVSLPMTVEPDGTMTCRLVMPFRKSCKIRLQNLGRQPVAVAGQMQTAPYVWDEARSMHFCCRWRINHDLVAGGGEMAQDLPVLFARGQGVYVGTAVMLMNPNACPSSDGNWWGEGDERVFIDDDTTRPSLAGTGTEDYFNYGWSSCNIFTCAYSGQSRNDGPANRGHVSEYRWHIVDPLPFRHSVAFFLELAAHRPTPGFSYGRACYYYARPGVIDDHVSITGEDVRLPVVPPWMPEAVQGASRSVFFQAEDVLEQGQATPLEAGSQWAGNKLLVWQPKRAGEEFVFETAVAESGKYLLFLVLRQDAKGGRVSVRVDDRPLRFHDQRSEILDLHVPHRILSRASAALDALELTAGSHRWTIRYEEPSKGQDAPEIGLDFFWLRRVP